MAANDDVPLAEAKTVPSSPADRVGDADAATAPSRHAASAIVGPAMGNVWARYVLESPIGEGGMGAVWRAYDPELDRRVALKVLHDDALGRASQERLRREARAIARIAHPSVVPVYDVGEHAGRSYYTMELVRGASLREWLRVPRDWREVAPVFADAARGLAAIHAAGLAHRDIKPGNILLGDDGRARVTDLGIALPDLTSHDGTSSDDGALLGSTTLRHAGTPAYMAPEQLDGAPGDAASDQFAFGLTLWEALHGRPPFAGETIAARRAALRGAPTARRQGPAWLDAVARRTLAVDPTARFPSMGAVATALTRAPSRRWPVLIALGALLAGGVTTAVLMTRPAPPPLRLPCMDAGNDLATAWTPAAADALAARLDLGDGTHARSVATQVDSVVDAWRAAARTACVRTAAAAWSTAIGERAGTCLARRASALRAAIRASTDDDLRARLYRVGDPARCLDPVFVSAQAAEPTDPAMTAALEGAVLIGDVAREIQDHGKADLAAAMVEHLAPTPDDPSWAAVRDTIAWIRYVARRDRDPAGAFALLEDAYYQARAAGADDVALSAAANLVNEAVSQLGDRERAERWLKIALADAARQPDLDATAGVYVAATAYANATGEFEQAIAWGKRAVAMMQRTFGVDDLPYAAALGQLATAYDLGGHAADAIAVYEQQLAILARWFGDASPRLADTRMNLALAHSGLGHHTQAVALAEQVVRAARGGAAREPLPYGRDLLNLGVILGEAHDFAASIAPLEEARAVLTPVLGPNHPDLALIATALVRSRASLLEDGDAAGLAAVLAEARAAVALARTANGADHPETATAENNLADVLARAGQCREAAPLADHVIAVLTRAGNRAATAMPLQLRGNCARAARDWASAATWYRHALEAATANIRDRSESRRRLVGVLMKAGDRATALTEMAARRRELAELAGATAPGALDDILAQIDRWLADPTGDPP
ncbi:MAG: serine/threonine-protein kinase [Deltaproteobacteria bacterium]|nr:serine/threonine-protein kinase [Deltaproteobacteria bacterium]